MEELCLFFKVCSPATQPHRRRFNAAISREMIFLLGKAILVMFSVKDQVHTQQRHNFIFPVTTHGTDNKNKKTEPSRVRFRIKCSSPSFYFIFQWLTHHKLDILSIQGSG